MQFIDLAEQQKRIKPQIDSRIQDVLAHGKYIMGPEVKELEQQLCVFTGAKYCLSCANGTDALQIAIMALGAADGDAIFVPSFTFAATAEAVAIVGATPVFVDIDLATYNIDVESLKRAIAQAKAQGLVVRGVIPVDLFGLSADYDSINAVAKAEGMWVIADSAQGFGATYRGKKSGVLADVTTTSFFPAKPLGCYGDGGALFTDDADVAAIMDSLRVHGKGTHKYDNDRVGMNSRLDTLQAAILLPKLAIYTDEIEQRQRVARGYHAQISDTFAKVHVPSDMQSVWAQYTLRAESEQHRDATMEALKQEGIPSVIYYPKPLHLQKAFADSPCDLNGLKNSKVASATVFSVPMHPYLNDEQIAFISAQLA